MSYPFSKTGKLTFEELLHQLHVVSEQLPDLRTGDVTYKMSDAALGAFSIFFTQSPSFLDFQRMLEKAKGCSNAQTLFNMVNIPSDNHIRNLLDTVEAFEFNPVYRYILERFERQVWFAPSGLVCTARLYERADYKSKKQIDAYEYRNTFRDF